MVLSPPKPCWWAGETGKTPPQAGGGAESGQGSPSQWVTGCRVGALSQAGLWFWLSHLVLERLERRSL